MVSCCSSNRSIGRPANGKVRHIRSGAEDWIRLGIAALVAGQSMAFGIAINVSPPEGEERAFIHALLAGSALFVFFVIGLPILRNAWFGVCERKINLDQFFLLGIAGSFAASLQATLSGRGNVYYEVVAVLVAIHTLGRILSERRREAALEAACKLRAAFDSCWKLTCCGEELRMPVSQIAPGDKVRVRSGEGVPVDGILCEGPVFVRETAFTGETFPVVKRAGDLVLAGSTLEDGVVVIEATQYGYDRCLDHLLRSLELAGERKSKLQREADKIVEWFLPTVAGVALLIFIGWTAAVGWDVALIHALTAIVVACPCALGLATPLAVWQALNYLAERGVLIKSGDALERLASINAAVFDKTGTLSSEIPAVVDFVTTEGFTREEVRRWVGMAQAGSLHPVARAFACWSVKGATNAPGSSDPVVVEELPGAGISVKLPEGILKIGNEGILLGESSVRDEAGRLSSLLLLREGQVRTFYVTLNDRVVAAAALRETLRSDTTSTVKWFESSGFQTYIMTGDPGWKPPSELELTPDRIRTGLRPEEKAAAVMEMSQNGAKVLFVGDGLNDAPAMRAAYASLAMGGGAELSRETASGEIFGGQLGASVVAVRVAKHTVSAMRNNMRYAVIYNCIGIGLAAAGILHPVVAAVIMLASSVTVSWRALNLFSDEQMQAENQPWRLKIMPDPSPETQFLPTQNNSAPLCCEGASMAAQTLK